MAALAKSVPELVNRADSSCAVLFLRIVHLQSQTMVAAALGPSQHSRFPRNNVHMELPWNYFGLSRRAMWCRDAEDLHGGAGLLLVTPALLARVLRQNLKAREFPAMKAEFWQKRIRGHIRDVPEHGE